MEFLTTFIRDTFALNEALSPIYLGCFVLFTALVYLVRREKGSFIAFLIPREIWSHRSIRVDVALIVINRLLSLFGLFARFAAVPVVATWVAEMIQHPALSGFSLSPLVLAGLVFVITDFTSYWIHRIHHGSRVLWPLHAVHHSASVLTPLTAYRTHPVAQMVTTAMATVIFGVVFGVLVGAFSPDLSLYEIAGVNAFVILSNLTVSNFHHSHIWVSFGPIIERLIISPAQHQIHHSVKPRHFNRNYGQVLAVWDWIFGTLYIIREKEVVTFGLTDKADAPLMTHRLGPILLDPLRRVFRSAR
ncbi:Sterol desaturase/sphingolipid hydroxylase, fatty acid hydroxylase superfamily [Octadecabacter temperatus]|uniref:Fatty acid hydroxylase superfamily protein n=1 Tax=Octadecabacter temperatus TaxID=1458307 RepID=A0A0K0Y610_9RHOB|nr:sterol desaturase family protein [Octadecabacter temperatus]AKS46331.1 Fatty acid hydroxylase superfamily protein [Octadecabacter temperatus]SIO12034.1 Sterol desaturase/sphingolipid hydroxylase, fatty acid hydroxylase superfamily [Octadecabacter temperatus]